MTDEATRDKIAKIFLDIEHLKGQFLRLVADAESEKEVRKRRNEEFDKLILKIESDFKDILYGVDRKSGLVIDVDRLNQIKKMIVWLSGAVGLLLLKTVFDIFSK